LNCGDKIRFNDLKQILKLERVEDTYSEIYRETLEKENKRTRSNMAGKLRSKSFYLVSLQSSCSAVSKNKEELELDKELTQNLRK